MWSWARKPHKHWVAQEVSHGTNRTKCHPFMGIPLPYGVGTFELKDFNFPKQSTTNFLDEKVITRFFLDTYPQNPNLTKIYILTCIGRF
jgi:hypothetical protein